MGSRAGSVQGWFLYTGGQEQYYPAAMFGRLFPTEGKVFFELFERHA
ncbi:MAG: hypothetical protein H6Q86_2984, partial [candidate division NC10 bacterium]|nr:hypothetical protein [candidate division NC10 bacterium]